jgi:hypothetical protein
VENNSRCGEPFTPAQFLDLLDKARKWFALFDTLRHLRWQRTVPEESPEGQAVTIMLRDRSRWLRN